MTMFFLSIAICLALAIVVGGLAVRTYNTLVAKQQLASNGFAQIEVQLKRRYDLIPSLVEVVSSYLSHERETLEAVITARNQASSQLKNVQGKLSDVGVVQSFAGAESALTGALGRMSMVIEDYPELKANESITRLTEELTSTENRISFAREVYNDTVTKFNVYRRTFPNVMFSSTVGFDSDLSLLEFEDAEQIQHAPKVELVGASI